MQILRGRRSGVNGLAVSPDARFVAAQGGCVHVWDLSEPGRPPAKLDGCGWYHSGTPFRADGRLFLDTLRGWSLYDPVSGRSVEWHWPEGVRPENEAELVCGPFVVEAHTDDTGKDRVTCWRLNEGGDRLHRQVVWSRPWNHSVELCAPDGGRVVLIRHQLDYDDRRTWRVTRVSDGKLLASGPCHGFWYNPARIAPDGVELFTFFRARIFAWNTHEGGESREVLSHPRRKHFRDIAVSPDGRTLAGVTGDNGISFFDRATGGLLRTYDFRVGELKHLAFTPDGTRCVAAGTRGTVLLFDVE